MPRGVYHRTAQHKAITSKAMTGLKLSEAHKLAIKKAHADPVVKDKIGLGVSIALKGKPKSPEHVEKVRAALKGRKMSDAQRLKLSLAHKGRITSEETREKLRLTSIQAHKDGRIPKLTFEIQEKGRAQSRKNVGILHPNWKVDRENLAKRTTQRTSADLTWAFTVKRADRKKCVLASSECQGCLESHHIRSYVSYPELRCDVDNGVTLCEFHHPRNQQKSIELIPVFEAIVLARKGSN